MAFFNNIDSAKEYVITDYNYPQNHQPNVGVILWSVISGTNIKVLYEVCEANSGLSKCSDCIFKAINCCQYAPLCSSIDRGDFKDVVFKPINISCE